MPLIAYPDVPQQPGVPPVLRQVGAIQSSLGTLAVNVGLVLDLLAPPQWGLFDADGQPALVADTVVTLEERQEQRLPTHQIEEGGFGTYNKVAQPYEGKVGYAQAGSLEQREAFMARVRELIASLELFTLVAPEYSVESVNVIHYDTSRRARNGSAMLQVDLWVQEVRLIPAAKFTSTKDASGTKGVDNGRISTTPAALGGSDAARQLDGSKVVIPAGFT